MKYQICNINPVLLFASPGYIASQIWRRFCKKYNSAFLESVLTNSNPGHFRPFVFFKKGCCLHFTWIHFNFVLLSFFHRMRRIRLWRRTCGWTRSGTTSSYPGIPMTLAGSRDSGYRATKYGCQTSCCITSKSERNYQLLIVGRFPISVTHISMAWIAFLVCRPPQGSNEIDVWRVGLFFSTFLRPTLHLSKFASNHSNSFFWRGLRVGWATWATRAGGMHE